MLWEETYVGKSFGLSGRTEVQGLTLRREAKEFLRAETRRDHKFIRIYTTARIFSVVTGQSLGDKSPGLKGLLARITRGYLRPYHGDRLDYQHLYKYVKTPQMAVSLVGDRKKLILQREMRGRRVFMGFGS